MTARWPRKETWVTLSWSIVLGLLLSTGALWLVWTQHDSLMQLTHVEANETLDFLAHITGNELQDGEYDKLPELFTRWVGQRAGVHSIRLVANNGYVLAEHRRRTDKALKNSLTLSRSIEYSYSGKAVLQMVRDLAPVYAKARKLLFIAGTATGVLTLLFGLLIYQSLRRKREAGELRLQSRHLQAANQRLVAVVDELERAENENRRLAAFPRENPNPIVVFDRHGEAVFENPAFTCLTADIRATRSRDILPPDHDELLARTRSLKTRVTTHYPLNSRHFNAQYHYSVSNEEVYVYLSELTAQRQAELRLRQEQSRALVTLASIGDAVLTTDSLGRVEYLNPTAERLCAVSRDDAIGHQLADILTLIREDSHEPLGNIASLCARRKVALSMQDRISLMRPDGTRFPIQATAAPIRSESEIVRGVVVVLRDVSRERQLQTELTRQATHDSLTGLLNRNAFETHLVQALDSARARGREHALCFIDLDQFKVVNDTCGHVAGDELLRQFGLLMRRHFRDGDDVIARLGGDEFAVLLHDCPMDQAVKRAENLREELVEQTFSWDQQVFRPGASIGITPINHDSKDIGQLLSAADAACYEAKDLGRNRVNLYNPDDIEAAQRHGEMHWVSRINNALERNLFTLYGQPILDLTDDGNEHWGVEVLLRMTEQDGTLIPPGAFLPAAERFNLIERLDRWVISKALDMLESCTRLPQQLFLNISGPTLNQTSFLPFLNDQLDRHPVDPKILVFEVTETAAIRNLASALNLIGELKALGARFALDDFGTGVSSFAYLKNLPVDFLKIDGSFVRDLDQDPLDQALVEAIHKVGTTLGLETIAEFIETRSILEHVRALGITRGQGYGVAAPRPLGELLAGDHQPGQPLVHADAFNESRGK